jgi:hypothetical protein
MKEKAVKYRNGFSEKSCINIKNIKVYEVIRENGSNTNNFGKNGK